MKEEPIWVPLPVVFALHQQQLSEHGGSAGVRDQGLIESALARPQQIFHYAESSSLSQLAAAYAVGLAKNHGFVDGNKRTAFLVSALFLRRNGWRLTAPQAEVVQMMLGVAAGSVDETQLAQWLESRIEAEG